MVNQKILIVDDSKTIRMQVSDMLPKGNFEVLEARDGVEALDLINRQTPNLVLLDFFMPRMNGWEVVQKIQSDPKLKAIPIVMMSGRREDVEKTVPELFEYFEFVGKPFEQAHLFRAIKSATVKAKERQSVSFAPKTAAPVAQPAPSATATDSQPPAISSSEDTQKLWAEIHQLRQQNVKLHAELEAVKKQMNQVVAYIRQKLN